MTLAFLGHIRDDRVADIVAAGSRCRGRPITLTLDKVGFWRRSRILWLGSSATPKALSALVDTVWARLAGGGVEPEGRVFQPHVTLARRAAPPRRMDKPEPVSWSVDSFALVESVAGPHGPHYEILESWPLRADAPAPGDSGYAATHPTI